MGYESKTKAELIAELEALRAAMKAAPRPGPPRPPGDPHTERLVEELRLHQVELEMQNRELRETQRELESSRDRYADLYDFAPVGYATLDEKGRIREINLTGASLLGVERSRLLGKSLLRYVAKADTTAFLGLVQSCRGAGSPVSGELRFEASGGTIWVHVRCAPADAGGADAGTCRLAITDIAERKQAEADRALLLARAEEARAEAEAANRDKDEFLAVVSHELRTPVNAVLAWSQLLLAGGLDAATSERALDAVVRNAHIQGRLIDDLLDVARIISGKVSLDRRPMDLAAVVRVVIDSIEPVARSKGVMLSPGPELGTALVFADPVRMQQVIWNLLSNAIKFTPAGGSVAVEMSREARSVTVLVRDTGEGIEPQFLPHIFERFRQADMTTRRKHGGIGLGLAIVHHLVELHEGSVRATSEGEGMGTTVTLSLPLVESGDGAARSFAAGAANTSGSALADAPSLEGLHVLVVEDTEDVQAVLTLLLEARGARVTCAGSARDALEAIERERPDVLVSDIGMPVEDGYDLIRSVRALRREYGGRTPAIALTAYASLADQTRALTAGFQAHVTKPVAAADLVAVVARVAGRGDAGSGSADATKTNAAR